MRADDSSGNTPIQMSVLAPPSQYNNANVRSFPPANGYQFSQTAVPPSARFINHPGFPRRPPDTRTRGNGSRVGEGASSSDTPSGWSSTENPQVPSFITWGLNAEAQAFVPKNQNGGDVGMPSAPRDEIMDEGFQTRKRDLERFLEEADSPSPDMQKGSGGSIDEDSDGDVFPLALTSASAQNRHYLNNASEADQKWEQSEESLTQVFAPPNTFHGGDRSVGAETIRDLWRTTSEVSNQEACTKDSYDEWAELNVQLVDAFHRALKDMRGKQVGVNKDPKAIMRGFLENPGFVFPNLGSNRDLAKGKGDDHKNREYGCFSSEVVCNMFGWSPGREIEERVEIGDSRLPQGPPDENLAFAREKKAPAHKTLGDFLDCASLQTKSLALSSADASVEGESLDVSARRRKHLGSQRSNYKKSENDRQKSALSTLPALRSNGCYPMVSPGGGFYGLSQEEREVKSEEGKSENTLSGVSVYKKGIAAGVKAKFHDALQGRERITPKEQFQGKAFAAVQGNLVELVELQKILNDKEQSVDMLSVTISRFSDEQKVSLTEDFLGKKVVGMQGMVEGATPVERVLTRLLEVGKVLRSISLDDDADAEYKKVVAGNSVLFEGLLSEWFALNDAGKKLLIERLLEKDNARIKPMAGGVMPFVEVLKGLNALSPGQKEKITESLLKNEVKVEKFIEKVTGFLSKESGLAEVERAVLRQMLLGERSAVKKAVAAGVGVFNEIISSLRKKISQASLKKQAKWSKKKQSPLQENLKSLLGVMQGVLQRQPVLSARWPLFLSGILHQQVSFLKGEVDEKVGDFVDIFEAVWVVSGETDEMRRKIAKMEDPFSHSQMRLWQRLASNDVLKRRLDPDWLEGGAKVMGCFLQTQAGSGDKAEENISISARFAEVMIRLGYFDLLDSNRSEHAGDKREAMLPWLIFVLGYLPEPRQKAYLNAALAIPKEAIAERQAELVGGKACRQTQGEYFLNRVFLEKSLWDEGGSAQSVFEKKLWKFLLRTLLSVDLEFSPESLRKAANLLLLLAKKGLLEGVIGQMNNRHPLFEFPEKLLTLRKLSWTEWLSHASLILQFLSMGWTMAKPDRFKGFFGSLMYRPKAVEGFDDQSIAALIFYMSKGEAKIDVFLTQTPCHRLSTQKRCELLGAMQQTLECKEESLLEIDSIGIPLEQGLEGEKDECARRQMAELEARFEQKLREEAQRVESGNRERSGSLNVPELLCQKAVVTEAGYGERQEALGSALAQDAQKWEEELELEEAKTLLENKQPVSLEMLVKPETPQISLNPMVEEQRAVSTEEDTMVIKHDASHSQEECLPQSGLEAVTIVAVPGQHKVWKQVKKSQKKRKALSVMPAKHFHRRSAAQPAVSAVLSSKMSQHTENTEKIVLQAEKSDSQAALDEAGQKKSEQLMEVGTKKIGPEQFFAAAHKSAVEFLDLSQSLEWSNYRDVLLEILKEKGSNTGFDNLMEVLRKTFLSQRDSSSDPEKNRHAFGAILEQMMETLLQVAGFKEDGLREVSSWNADLASCFENRYRGDCQLLEEQKWVYQMLDQWIICKDAIEGEEAIFDRIEHFLAGKGCFLKDLLESKVCRWLFRYFDSEAEKGLHHPQLLRDGFAVPAWGKIVREWLLSRAFFNELIIGILRERERALGSASLKHAKKVVSGKGRVLNYLSQKSAEGTGDYIQGFAFGSPEEKIAYRRVNRHLKSICIEASKIVLYFSDPSGLREDEKYYMAKIWQAAGELFGNQKDEKDFQVELQSLLKEKFEAGKHYKNVIEEVQSLTKKFKEYRDALNTLSPDEKEAFFQVLENKGCDEAIQLVSEWEESWQRGGAEHLGKMYLLRGSGPDWPPVEKYTRYCDGLMHEMIKKVTDLKKGKEIPLVKKQVGIYVKGLEALFAYPKPESFLMGQRSWMRYSELPIDCWMGIMRAIARQDRTQFKIFLKPIEAGKPFAFDFFLRLMLLKEQEVLSLVQQANLKRCSSRCNIFANEFIKYMNFNDPPKLPDEKRNSFEAEVSRIVHAAFSEIRDFSKEFSEELKESQVMPDGFPGLMAVPLLWSAHHAGAMEGGLPWRRQTVLLAGGEKTRSFSSVVVANYASVCLSVMERSIDGTRKDSLSWYGQFLTYFCEQVVAADFFRDLATDLEAMPDRCYLNFIVIFARENRLVCLLDSLEGGEVALLRDAFLSAFSYHEEEGFKDPKLLKFQETLLPKVAENLQLVPQGTSRDYSFEDVRDILKGWLASRPAVAVAENTPH